MKTKQVEIPLQEYCWQEVWALIFLFTGYLGVCALILVGIAKLFG